MTQDGKRYLLLPWRVSHSNGDVVAGFDTESDAKADAMDRNEKAKRLGIVAGYVSGPKP